VLWAAVFNLVVLPEALGTWHFTTLKEEPLIETHQVNSHFCLLWLCFQLFTSEARLTIFSGFSDLLLSFVN